MKCHLKMIPNQKLFMWLSRLVLSLMMMVVVGASATSTSSKPKKGATGEGGGGGSGAAINCIRCDKCELGVYLVSCKPGEVCFSHSELSERRFSYWNSVWHKCKGFLCPGQFQNITQKGCTGKENYCEDLSSDQPCYTCDWNLCNPEVRQAFRGDAPPNRPNRTIVKKLRFLLSTLTSFALYF